MTHDEFDERFTPILNPFDDNASWDGCMFETYGDELAYVQEQPDANVWTIIDGGGTEPDVLMSGKMRINRIGFIVTEQRWTDRWPLGAHVILD